KSLMAQSKRIPLGSDRHAGLWETAAKRLSARLEKLGINDRVLVVNAPWAKSDQDGESYETFLGQPVQQVSDRISALTDILRSQGLEVISLPTELSVGDSHHKWGREPFHFGQEAMRWIADQMRDR